MASYCFRSLPACPPLGQAKLRSQPRLPNASLKPKPELCFKESKFNSQIKGQQRICELFDLHQQQIPYEMAWSWQKEIVREKKALIENEGDCTDTLIVLQHPPVYTLGTASSQENLHFDIKNPPFDIYRTERGGEVTYHGPGQLVMYPIINLRNHKMDLHWYLRTLEEVVIRVLSSTFSIKASRLDGLPGVWVGNQKVAAVGIRVFHWITYHGLALNVTTDLDPFNWIVPCGIRERQVGSVKGLLRGLESFNGSGTAELLYPEDASLIAITHKSLIKEFSRVFELECHHKTTSVQLLHERKLSSLAKDAQRS